MTERSELATVIRCPSHGCLVRLDIAGHVAGQCAGCMREAVAGLQQLNARHARRMLERIGGASS